MKTLGEELSCTLSSYGAMKKNIEALTKDLSERNGDLDKSQKDFSKYHACHARGAKGLHDDIIRTLKFFNLPPPLFSVRSCIILQFYDWVSVCVELLCKRRKMYGELSATVGVRALTHSMCSLFPSDAPLSEKSISKNDVHVLGKSSHVWPFDTKLSPEHMPILPKNIAKNFMMNFIKTRRDQLARDESERLSNQVCFISFICLAFLIALHMLIFLWFLFL